MKKNITLLFLIFGILFKTAAQERLSYFLPENVTYDSKITTPEEFFSQQMGEWHLTHDQVLNYIKEMARKSDRAIIQEYARSHENRPLVHLIFTSPENLGRLEELKQLHRDFANPESEISKDGVPLV